MTTAAEALEKVLQVMMEPRIMELATIRAGENCNKHNIAATIRTAVDEALRAALAATQPDEARELLRESMNQHIYDEGPPDLIERIRAYLKDRT